MNIKYKTVIIDEAQNFTASELKKVFTRIHDSCKVIVIGHSGQIDLYDKSQSGFIPYINHLKDKDYVSICNLSVNFRGRFATDSDLIDVHTY
jgi:phosphate starvation-inducible protein PhoH